MSFVLPHFEPKAHTDARQEAACKTLWGCVRVFFRFIVPRLLGIKILIFALIRPFVGGVDLVDFLMILAIGIYWPFQEWFAHLFLLHFKPRRWGPITIDIYSARVHRFHHRSPWLLEATFLPWEAILFLIPVNIAFWWAITSTLAHAVTGIIFFTFAALVYEWVHYLTHTIYRPKSKYYRRIWKNHRLHHFKNEKYWHSFTVPALDVLMGTAPPEKDVPVSETVRTLGVEETFEVENIST